MALEKNVSVTVLVCELMMHYDIKYFVLSYKTTKFHQQY